MFCADVICAQCMLCVDVICAQESARDVHVPEYIQLQVQ